MPSSFETQQDKNTFLVLLKEMGFRLFSLGLVIGLTAFYFGLFRPQNETYTCDMEYTRDYKGISQFYNGSTFFSGGGAQNKEEAHTGLYSTKLSPEKKFGLDFKIPNLVGNEYVKASFWRKGTDKDIQLTGIVLDIKGIFWERGTKAIEKTVDGWEKVQIEMKPQANMKYKDLQIYIWHTGNKEVYIDDLEVSVERREAM